MDHQARSVRGLRLQAKQNEQNEKIRDRGRPTVDNKGLGACVIAQNVHPSGRSSGLDEPAFVEQFQSSSIRLISREVVRLRIINRFIKFFEVHFQKQEDGGEGRGNGTTHSIDGSFISSDRVLPHGYSLIFCGHRFVIGAQDRLKLHRQWISFF